MQAKRGRPKKIVIEIEDVVVPIPKKNRPCTLTFVPEVALPLKVIRLERNLHLQLLAQTLEIPSRRVIELTIEHGYNRPIFLTRSHCNEIFGYGFIASFNLSRLVLNHVYLHDTYVGIKEFTLTKVNHYYRDQYHWKSNDDDFILIFNVPTNSDRQLFGYCGQSRQYLTELNLFNTQTKKIVNIITEYLIPLKYYLPHEPLVLVASTKQTIKELQNFFHSNGWKDVIDIIYSYFAKDIEEDHGRLEKRNRWFIGNQEEISKRKYFYLIANKELVLLVLTRNIDMFEYNHALVSTHRALIDMWFLFRRIYHGEDKWKAFVLRNQDLFLETFNESFFKPFVKYTESDTEKTAWYWRDYPIDVLQLE